MGGVAVINLLIVLATFAVSIYLIILTIKFLKSAIRALEIYINKNEKL